MVDEEGAEAPPVEGGWIIIAMMTSQSEEEPGEEEGEAERRGSGKNT